LTYLTYLNLPLGSSRDTFGLLSSLGATKGLPKFWVAIKNKQVNIFIVLLKYNWLKWLQDFIITFD
jgi:hypothetical protein